MLFTLIRCHDDVVYMYRKFEFISFFHKVFPEVIQYYYVSIEYHICKGLITFELHCLMCAYYIVLSEAICCYLQLIKLVTHKLV